MPDALLAELDWVIAAAHDRHALDRRRQTDRILRALDNPHVHALAHPTGRLLLAREPADLDLDGVIARAAENGVALEMNAQPRRMDLDDTWARVARDAGATLVMSTDAHGVADLGNMARGVASARRAWLRPADVLNARPWEEVEERLRR